MGQGRIIRGIGGFYDVQLSDGTAVTCKARGKLRAEKLTPMVGDLVEVQPQADGYWALQSILPRRNALTRPPVANIDQLVVVSAAASPKPDWLLTDKLLLQASLLGVSPVPVLNKLDRRDPSIVETFLTEYAAFDPLCVSASTGEGLDPLRERLTGKVSCFAGQSAVGKSSLLNMLLPELKLETGGLAKKTDRGKHTTRMARLWPYRGGAVLDTPGFSLFELNEIEQEALDAAYPEFGDAPKLCRFAGCTHAAEPDCGVKALLESGALSPGRYERYITLLDEVKQRRKHRYD